MSLQSENSPLLGLEFLGQKQTTLPKSKLSRHDGANNEQKKNMVWTILLSSTALFALFSLQRNMQLDRIPFDKFANDNISSFEKDANLAEELLTKFTKRHTHQTPLYTKVQTLSFQIYTGGAPAFIDGMPNEECVNLNSYGQAEGSADLQCYLGLDDTALDVRRRLNIMRDAVDKAYDVSNSNEDTLKIFLAPEFYFRGKNGAFEFLNEEQEDEHGCSDICHILKGLEEIVADKRFENWLFLFGTVIGSEALPQKDQFDYQFYNFAPLYKGFDPAVSKRIGKNFIVPKRYVSNIDFLTPLRHLTNRSIAMELLDEQDPKLAGTLMNPHLVGHKKYDK